MHAALPTQLAPCPPSLIVVRHAQSEHHVRGLTGGWTDTSLTELGHEQALLLTERLKTELAGMPITLYVSDLRRCLETAAPIARGLGAEIVREPRLREHNNGAAAGLTLAEAEARFPEAFKQFLTLTPEFRPFPDAETWGEFYERLAGFLAGLSAEGPLPVLVTHGGSIMNIVRWWLRLDPATVARTWFATHPTSVTVLRADAWGMRGIERLNDIAHLYRSPSWDAYSHPWP